MGVPRRLFLRLTFIVASIVTALFLLSTIFIFGAATHRRQSLGWVKSSANADLVQLICVRGQFHLTVEFLELPGFPPSSEARGWHAGVKYLPGLELNVLNSDRVTSKYGADVYWERRGPRLYVGVFGLYPALLTWALVYVAARRKPCHPGRCVTCGYDLRASPDRCPECGNRVDPDLSPTVDRTRSEAGDAIGDAADPS